VVGYVWATTPAEALRYRVSTGDTNMKQMENTRGAKRVLRKEGKGMYLEANLSNVGQSIQNSSLLESRGQKRSDSAPR